jgi:hypothetical protein
MTGYQIAIEAWNYATGGEVSRPRIVMLLAKEYGAQPDAVREVLDAYKARVDALYSDTEHKPSLASLEAEDDKCLDALGNLEKITEEEEVEA